MLPPQGYCHNSYFINNCNLHFYLFCVSISLIMNSFYIKKNRQEVFCSSDKYQSLPNQHTSTVSYSSFRNEPHSLHRNVSSNGNQSSLSGNRSCMSGKSESITDACRNLSTTFPLSLHQQCQQLRCRFYSALIH